MDGGKVVVVISQREKLEMEAMYRQGAGITFGSSSQVGVDTRLCLISVWESNTLYPCRHTKSTINDVIYSVIATRPESDGSGSCAVLRSRVVVLSARFLMRRRAIPEKSRLGTQFVFRQGSPLNIMDLRDIAVAQAAAVIVLGDNSRSVLLVSSGRKTSHKIMSHRLVEGGPVPAKRRACMMAWSHSAKAGVTQQR